MSHDSGTFKTFNELISEGAIQEGNTFVKEGSILYVPVYEGKMMGIYNHHFASWPLCKERPTVIPDVKVEDLADPSSLIMPWYWTPLNEVYSKLEKRGSNGDLIWEWKHFWLLGYRKITNATTERTFISSIIPMPLGAGDSIIYMMIDDIITSTIAQGIMSSIVFDYVARQKLGGLNMSNFITKQLPILTDEQIPSDMQWEITRRVAELTYFNHDLDGWAEELYDELTDEQQLELPQLGEKKPFIYDPERRAVLQAELDAIIGHLYGLNTEDMRYILDPEDVCGPGCINETFRVLKSNEIRQYGEYRTKRLVLEAWERMGYN